jgi:hypothetical protein
VDFARLRQVRFTTSGGLKTVKQLSRIRTTKTKIMSLVSTLFEFENQTLVDTECILMRQGDLTSRLWGTCGESCGGGHQAAYVTAPSGNALSVSSPIPFGPTDEVSHSELQRAAKRVHFG